MMEGPDWSLAAAAYDSIAGRYDRIPEENRVNRVLRMRSLTRLRALFRAGSRVLEIGSGTGEEALALAAKEVRVAAVDPSPAMVRLAEEKARARGLADRASFRILRARDLPALPESDGSFDGAYASFSLAYEPDLRPVAEGLRRLLRPGAPFAASVPSRVCFAEWLAVLATLQPDVSGRRLRPWHGHTVGDHAVPIRTYTPRGLAAELAPSLVLVRWEALVALVPPPYMGPWYGRLAGLADAIERVDDAVRAHPPFRSVGDHFLAEFRRA